jgi:3-oxoadipate CoA-transferase alpha subunit
MIDKFVDTVSDAVAGIEDGAVIALGGFGAVGLPNHLLEGVIQAGVRDLTLVMNNAGGNESNVAELMRLGRVRKLFCSFPRARGGSVFDELYHAGKIELEIVPQGLLAERMRAASAGIPGFYTATSVGTVLAEGKEEREFPAFDDRRYILSEALKPDIALVECWKADRWGNLTYRGSGRNFNPVMAAAAERTFVQTQHVVELGELDPEVIVTPGIFVNRVVHVPYGDPRGF